MVPAPFPPRFSLSDAGRIARDCFGVVAASVRELPSERDQNFLLRSASGDAFVLKLAQAGEDRAILESQNEVLALLAAAETPYRFPRVRLARDGEAIVRVEDHQGTAFLARLLEHLPGVPLAGVRPRSPELLRGLGRLLGTVDRVLEGFSHPAADRVLHWDLRCGREVVERHLSEVPDAPQRLLVERFLALFDETAAPLLPHLRTSVIHGDGNDHNVLVSEVAPGADPFEPRRILGIVDFGDMVRSYTAGEAAVAAAYAMLERADPLAAAAHVVAGYHEAYPLTPVELEAVFPLACLRLCMSVVLSAHQAKRFPENHYLRVSEAPAWALLERLCGVSPRFAHYLLRDACGLEPCPQTPVVLEWLQANASRMGAVLDEELLQGGTLVLDLSVGSLELADLSHSPCVPGRTPAPETAKSPKGSGASRTQFLGRNCSNRGDVPPPPTADSHAAWDVRAWMDTVFRRMRVAGARVGIGRYDEPRRWYAGPAFRIETHEGPEWRTIHLGIDLFVEPGTPVLAPLDGVVHSFRDNARRFAYGPTVILEHRSGDGRVRFWTLYAHLGRDSLAGLEVGRSVRRGEVIGRVGPLPENGDWPPHLHFQIITDLLGCDGDFPGVARPSQRTLWRSLCPDPNLVLRLPAARPYREAMSRDAIIEARHRLIGPNLSLSYRHPLHIVRGWMQHLFDDAGQPYLDCVNNVAHVGHGHPRVVAAMAAQSAALNTNTRYLHQNLVRLAERLAAKLPEPLRVCFFVCSGSEANELALRLARAHTGRRDVIVLEGAYHGNTTSLIEISPYKFDGPGGEGAPPHVHKVPLPDGYRGLYRGPDQETARAYAGHVREAAEAVRAQGRGIAAFFCEPLPSCAGQIVPPRGYLAEAFEHVRAAGGVCVADEVQTGFGRVGERFWAFELEGVVPDIVTMGKPMGNGHPVGAVVTTPEIAASFANGMEYFNTFGGNPVACAAALAVLDAIEDEGLQEHARRVGDYLRERLRQLATRHALVGDVRGHGLFIGVELVLDRETLEPATRQAAYVVERARERGVLLSTDGPFQNVLKIKPPLVFSETDADRLAETLDAILAEDVVRGSAI